MSFYLPKVTKFSKVIILWYDSIDAISLKIFLVRQKYVASDGKMYFGWKTKIDKKIWIWNSKIPKMIKFKKQQLKFDHLGDFWIFESEFFSHFCFFIQNSFLVREYFEVLLSHPKNIYRLIASEESQHKIITLLNLVTLGGGGYKKTI